MTIDQTNDRDQFALGGAQNDAELIAAETGYILAGQQRDQAPDRDDEGPIWAAMHSEWWRLIEVIHRTPPKTMTGVAIKLRLLAHDEIADIPASGLVGIAVKAYLAVYQGADFPQRKGGALGVLDERYYRYGDKGELHLSARLFRGLVTDAARFAPDLAPLAAAVINSPTVLLSGDGDAA